MNHPSLLTLLLFLVLQGLIYTACLFKLAEVRRQNLPPRVKLKLLENEDHLFDAGLYLGFVGTIISLILVSFFLGTGFGFFVTPEYSALGDSGAMGDGGALARVYHDVISQPGLRWIMLFEGINDALVVVDADA